MAGLGSMDHFAGGPEPAARRTSGIRATRIARQPGARGVSEGGMAALIPARRRFVLVAACVAALWTAHAAPAPPLTEYQVKAAYLFNFGQFVEWPAAAYSSPTAPFVIGIVGEDP